MSLLSDRNLRFFLIRVTKSKENTSRNITVCPYALYLTSHECVSEKGCIDPGFLNFELEAVFLESVGNECHL